MNENRHSDDEILNGVRRRLAGAEPLIPQAPALGPAFTESAQVRPRVVVRSRLGLGSFAPMVLVAALVVVAVGVGVGSQAFKGSGSGGAPSAGAPSAASSSAALPNNQGFGLSYQLVHPAGTQVTPAELDATKAVLIKRAESLGPTSYSVNEAPPDGITVWLEGVADTAEVRTLIGQTGHLEFVLLPPETYGTADAPGQKPVPSKGDAIDSSLPVQFTGADLDLGAISAAVDTSMSAETWVVNFAFKEAAATAFETWSGQHINEYFAIVLDGKVLSVPYIKSTIVGGKGEISGNFTAQSAADLATILQSGWLPYPLLGGVSESGPIGSPDAGPGVAPSDVPMESGGAIHSGAPIKSDVPLQSGVPSAVASPSAASSPQV
jgi:protein-export membrane protein SecD